MRSASVAANAFLIVGVLGASSCVAGDATVANPRPIEGRYFLYAGKLNAPSRPIPPHGAKVRLAIEGDAAASLYAQIGAEHQVRQDLVPPDAKIRDVGDLECVVLKTGTECRITIDLKTGKSSWPD